MDRKAIRKALDHFENDQFVDAKEIISREVAGARDIYVKNKVGLANDINPAPDADVDQNLDAEGDQDIDDNKGDEE